MRRALPVLAVAAATTASLALTGCAAGQAAATMHEHTTIDAINGDVGDVSLRAVALEAAPQGSPAALDMSLLDNGTQADELTGVEAGDLGGTLMTTPDPLDVGAGSTLRTSGTSGAGPHAVLTGLKGALAPGQTYPVTFHFRRSGSITLNVPVVLPTTASPAG